MRFSPGGTKLARMKEKAIDLLDPRDRSAIERIVTHVLGEGRASLKLFGSRARGDARRTSDIDVALLADRAVSAAELAAMREALEESIVPVRVDLVDYARAPSQLRAAIDSEGIVWPA